MPSEKLDLLNRIKEAQNKADESFHAGLRKALEAVNRADYLTEEQKIQLAQDFLK